MAVLSLIYRFMLILSARKKKHGIRNVGVV